MPGSSGLCPNEDNEGLRVVLMWMHLQARRITPANTGQEFAGSATLCFRTRKDRFWPRLLCLGVMSQDIGDGSVPGHR